MKFHLLILTALSCGILGCGGAGESGSGQTITGDYVGEGSEVKICLRSEPIGLNPILSVQNISRYVSEQIFQTLNDQDSRTFELVPLLASVPEVREEDDGTTSYSYRIDSMATWPDGSPVVGTDVLFSLKALMNPFVDSGPYRPYYEMVKDVLLDTADARSFRVITKYPYILAAQAIGDLYVYPEYAYDPDGLLREMSLQDLTSPEKVAALERENDNLSAFAETFNSPAVRFDPDKIIGSGPYRLTEWYEGQELSLERRPDYWAANRTEDRLTAVPDRLTFVIIQDPGTTLNALRDRAVDVVIDMPEDLFQRLRYDDYLGGYYNFEAVPGFRYFSILLNQDDPLLADSVTRRALAYTVDVDAIIKQLLPGLARRIVGPVLPTKTYYNNELPVIPYNLGKARELLAESGWSDTNGDGIVDKLIDGERRELSFRLLSYPTPTSEAVSIVIAQGARSVGVDIEVVKQEPRALLAALDAGNFSASFYGQGFEPTPDDFAQVWSSTSVPPAGTNRGNFSNPEADRLIQEIARTTDTEDRAVLYRRFQEIIYRNQPMIFLYSPFDRLVISKRFEYNLSSIAPNLKFNAIQTKTPDRATL